MSLRITHRSRRAGGFLALAVLAFAACPLPAAGQGTGGRGIPADADVRRDDSGYAVIRFQRSIEPRGALRMARIVNPWGDVRVRTSPGDAIGLSVVVQRLADDRPLPDFETVERRGRLEVRVSYPGDPPRVSAGGERPGRVDLAVFVPQGAALEVETDDGELRVAHRSAPIRARSTSGRILVSGGDVLDVASVSGPILARQVGGVPGPSRVRSDSGPVTVLVSPRGDQLVRVRAGGGISEGPGWTEADALELAPGATRWERRWGSGRHRFEIESAKGEVFLMPKLEVDDPDANGDEREIDSPVR